MNLGDRMREAQNGEPDWRPPDNWRGRVKLIDGGAFTARTSGKDWAKATLQVLSGDHVGRRFDHMMSLEPRALPISVESLLVYGVQLDAIDSIDDLDSALIDLAGQPTEYDITVRINNDFVNVTVHAARTGESDVTPPTPEAAGRSFDELVGDDA